MKKKFYINHKNTENPKKVICKIRQNNNFVLSIYKSSRYVYIRVIDNSFKYILFSLSSISKFIKVKYREKNKTILSELLGNEVSKILKRRNIKKVSFVKGKYKYHGNIKSILEKVRLYGIVV